MLFQEFQPILGKRCFREFQEFEQFQEFEKLKLYIFCSTGTIFEFQLTFSFKSRNYGLGPSQFLQELTWSPRARVLSIRRAAVLPPSVAVNRSEEN